MPLHNLGLEHGRFLHCMVRAMISADYVGVYVIIAEELQQMFRSPKIVRNLQSHCIPHFSQGEVCEVCLPAAVNLCSTPTELLVQF